MVFRGAILCFWFCMVYTRFLGGDHPTPGTVGADMKVKNNAVLSHAILCSRDFLTCFETRRTALFALTFPQSTSKTTYARAITQATTSRERVRHFRNITTTIMPQHVSHLFLSFAGLMILVKAGLQDIENLGMRHFSDARDRNVKLIASPWGEVSDKFPIHEDWQGDWSLMFAPTFETCVARPLQGYDQVRRTELKQNEFPQ